MTVHDEPPHEDLAKELAKELTPDLVAYDGSTDSDLPCDGLSLIASRHCKRAFLDRAVPRDVLAEVLLAAGQAPSGRNIQPWRMTVVTGSPLDALTRTLCEGFDRGEPPRPDCANRTPTLDDIAAERARAALAGVLRAKGHAPDDPSAARAHLRDNLHFYGAPAALVCHVPGDAVPGTFLEAGLFLQNVMLGLVARGLGSCPQFSVAGYADALRRKLDIDADRLIVCTLAVGYPDEAAPVNRFVPQRARLEEYVHWS
ncbi:nitroreductase [Streptomyces sp. NBC_01352]|uniref:nitroreductase n=1 Tax=unclassified Streptomyces TaxID=2593676 RepID=UPI00225049CC|nr:MULTISPECIES: nitroreductase [unclassified Streptomyces]MCX4702632.1 nitroreductase [Streptomyces sp. NBC_01373]